MVAIKPRLTWKRLTTIQSRLVTLLCANSTRSTPSMCSTSFIGKRASRPFEHTPHTGTLSLSWYSYVLGHPRVANRHGVTRTDGAIDR